MSFDYSTIEICSADCCRLSAAFSRLRPYFHNNDIVDVDYEDITDIEEEEPGEEAYCVQI